MVKNIKKLNELSGKVLELEAEVESLVYKLQQLNADKPTVTARLSLEINGNKRGLTIMYLRLDEVKSILDTRLVEKRLEYQELKKEYDQFINS